MTVGSATPLFQLIVLGISLVYFYWAYSAISEALLDGTLRPPPRAVRLSVLGLRNATVSPAAGNPLAFGLLRDGCVIPPASIASNGSSVTVVSLTALQPRPLANGYFISIAAGGQAAKDPVRWAVEAQADGSDGWLIVGASVQRGQGSLAAFFPHLAYPTPVAVPGSDVHVLVDGRPSWPWILAEVGTYSTAGCGLMVSVILAWIGQNCAVIWMVSSVFGSNAVLQLAAAAGSYAQREGGWRVSAVAFIYFAGNGVIAVMLSVNERLILSAMPLFSVFFFLALVRCCLSSPFCVRLFKVTMEILSIQTPSVKLEFILKSDHILHSVSDRCRWSSIP